MTDFYASGFPRTWTVLPSEAVQIKMVDGRREYKLGEDILSPARVVQIDRNPTTGRQRHFGPARLRAAGLGLARRR